MDLSLPLIFDFLFFSFRPSGEPDWVLGIKGDIMKDICPRCMSINVRKQDLHPLFYNWWTDLIEGRDLILACDDCRTIFKTMRQWQEADNKDPRKWRSEG